MFPFPESTIVHGSTFVLVEMEFCSNSFPPNKGLPLNARTVMDVTPISPSSFSLWQWKFHHPQVEPAESTGSIR